MGGEIYQAQVIKNFFDTITGPDRNLTRITMCVLTLAKLRMEPPDRLSFLLDQMRRSRDRRELSVDVLDYVCDAAVALDLQTVQTAFGVKSIKDLAADFENVSLDTL